MFISSEKECMCFLLFSPPLINDVGAYSIKQGRKLASSYLSFLAKLKAG